MIIFLSIFYEAKIGNRRRSTENSQPNLYLSARGNFSNRRLWRTTDVVNFLRIFEAFASLFPRSAKVARRLPSLATNYTSHSFCDAKRKKKTEFKRRLIFADNNVYNDLYPASSHNIWLLIIIGLRRATLILNGFYSFTCQFSVFPKFIFLFGISLRDLQRDKILQLFKYLLIQEISIFL